MIGTLPRVEKANWQNWVNHLTHAYNCTTADRDGAFWGMGHMGDKAHG